MTDKEQLLELERIRCKAIGCGDLQTLASVMTEDYIHVYGFGKTSTKQEYVDHIGDVPREPERGEIDVRIYGETAVMCGPLINRISPPGKPLDVVSAVATQVAVKRDNQWRFCHFQMTRCGPPPAK